MRRIDHIQALESPASKFAINHLQTLGVGLDIDPGRVSALSAAFPFRDASGRTVPGEQGACEGGNKSWDFFSGAFSTACFCGEIGRPFAF